MYHFRLQRTDCSPADLSKLDAGRRPIRRRFGSGAVLVGCEAGDQLGDRVLLVDDDLLELGDSGAAVLGLGVSPAGVVAGAAAGLQVCRIPEELRELRGRQNVMAGIGVANAAWPLDLALVSVAREHLAAEPLPGCSPIAAVAHGF